MHLRLETRLKPLLKYPGGKTSELTTILEHMPEQIENYVEPFVGGGAVYFSTKAIRYYINDISHELISLYKYIKDGNKTFLNELDIIISNWQVLPRILEDGRLVRIFHSYKLEQNDEALDNEINRVVTENFNANDEPMFNLKNVELFVDSLKKSLKAKIKVMLNNEIKKSITFNEIHVINNLEAGIKAAYYTYLRSIYNNPKLYKGLSEPRKVAIYFFIREYCYSSMFRFNPKGEFNVPYGGISYNKKTLIDKRQYFDDKDLKKHLKNTIIEEQDFYAFVNDLALTRDDFMFLDPPYDTAFSEYDKNQFSQRDQERLADYLINHCSSKFLLIIKKTDFIYNLYCNRGLNICEIEKKYSVNFMERNDKDVVHLIIKNY